MKSEEILKEKLRKDMQDLILRFEIETKQIVTNVESYYGDIIDLAGNEIEGIKFLISTKQNG